MFLICYNTGDAELNDLFALMAKCNLCKVITDRENGAVPVDLVLWNELRYDGKRRHCPQR